MDKQKLLKLHKKGLTNRAISKRLGCHHNTVGYNLKKLGLSSNWDKNQPIKIIDKNRAECSKCGDIRALSEFQYGRKGQKYEYKFSYCNECRKKQIYLNLNKSIERFLAYKFNRIKMRAKKINVKFNLDKKSLINLYNKQDGKCFYTGYEMKWGVDVGVSRNSLSVDRISPNKGYTKDNIVLCCNFINTVKSDLSLDEIKRWMPPFYEKIKFLI